MAAIEQGIFTATTKSRLLELEADIASLEQSIRDAKAISEGKLLEKERVVYFLTSLREGNLHSKTYQKRLIDTFVRAVYLWDDRIGIDYYYAGKDSMVKYSLSEIEADIGENIREVLKDSLTGHHVAADCISFAATFYASHEKSLLTHFVAAPPKIAIADAGLRFCCSNLIIDP